MNHPYRLNYPSFLFFPCIPNVQKKLMQHLNFILPISFYAFFLTVGKINMNILKTQCNGHNEATEKYRVWMFFFLFYFVPYKFETLVFLAINEQYTKFECIFARHANPYMNSIHGTCTRDLVLSILCLSMLSMQNTWHSIIS